MLLCHNIIVKFFDDIIASGLQKSTAKWIMCQTILLMKNFLYFITFVSTMLGLEGKPFKDCTIPLLLMVGHRERLKKEKRFIIYCIFTG